MCGVKCWSCAAFRGIAEADTSEGSDLLLLWSHNLIFHAGWLPSGDNHSIWQQAQLLCKTILVMEIHKSLLVCWPLERDRRRCFASANPCLEQFIMQSTVAALCWIQPFHEEGEKSADRLYSTANKLCWLLTSEQELDTGRALCRIQAKLGLAKHEVCQREN